MYRNLRYIYGQDDEAIAWRAHQREVWAEAERMEQESIEDARRMYEQHQIEQAWGELQQIVYMYLMDEMTEEYARINMANAGFNPDGLERLALDMIDTLDNKAVS